MHKPRLVATSGWSKGAEWPANGSVSLGRDLSNKIVVSDVQVSRKHCLINEGTGGDFEVVDLDSHNGTLVNGTRVSRQVLQNGDRLCIGSSEYLFLIGPDGPESDNLTFNGLEETQCITVAFDPAGGPQDSSWVGHMARDLAAFFKVANVINSTRDALALQLELLAVIAEVIPAEHGAVVLQPNNLEEPGALCIWSRNGLPPKQMPIRQDLVQQAIWECCAVFTAAAAETAEHVLCAPLAALERTLGAIYLSAPASSPAFCEEQAYFLSSVSRIAAVTLESLFKLDSLRAENEGLRREVKAEATLIGESRPMLRVTAFIERVARGDSTVLIRGESGTGKELIARALHYHGLRPHKPFVAINCAAIPEALLESELFGHEKGAFTGAVAVRKGKFETAEDGTLFLDEIGEMAPLLQAKLLRVLQQKEFERLGGTRLLPLNARVVAATNKNLETAIKSGEFRQDLYYRLNVISVVSPALREHREDIPLLALHFANKYAAKGRRSFKGIAAEARSLMMQYSWPGNVRELENAIEHAIVMGLTDEILPEDLPDALLEEQSPELVATRYHSTVTQTKKQLVLTALAEAHGSPVDAARLLGIHPKYLHRLIRTLNLKSDGNKLA